MTTLGLAVLVSTLVLATATTSDSPRSCTRPSQEVEIVFRDEQELLTDIGRIHDQIPQFMLEFSHNATSADHETAVAFRLVDIAEQLLRHVRNRHQSGPTQPGPGRPP